MTITEFLLARIAEDEAVAQRVRGTAFGEWQFVPDPDGRLGGYVAPGGAYPSPATAIANDWSGRQIGAGYVSVAEHIARHDPARVLAECEAKQRIVALHRQAEGPNYRGTECCARCTADGEYPADDDYTDEQNWPCPTLRALAAVYADHEDYREEWRP